MSVGDVQVAEPARAGERTDAIFKVTLDGPARSGVSISWRTRSQSARSSRPRDYVAASGTVGIAKGRTEATIRVAVLGDSRDEGLETFGVELTSVRGGKIGRRTGTATITPHFALILGRATTVEPKAGAVAVTSVKAQLSNPTDENVRFRWGAGALPTLTNPATPGVDFVQTLAYATIPAGQTSVDLPVTTRGDNSPERTEEVAVVVDQSTIDVPVVNEGLVSILDNGASSAPPPTSPPPTSPPPPDAPPPDAPPPVVAPRASSIGDYLAMHGDQVVIVPNGTYRGADSNVAHPATNGAYKGWLVLVAQSQGGAVVDLSSARLWLGTNASRVLFVGFRFINGTVTVEGHDVAFWYTDHVFPHSAWGGENSLYRSPRTLDFNRETTANVSVIGADVHDASTLIRGGSSSSVHLQGVRLYGSSPTELGHNDAISTRGGARDFEIRDSEIHGRVVFTDGESRDTPQEPVSDLVFSNTWFEGSPSAGVFFGALTKPSGSDAGRRGIFGSMSNVYIWDANGVARMEQILQSNNSLRNYYDESQNQEPSRVRVLETGVHYGPPPAGTPSPALQWRQSHPYSSWPSLFGY